jgi:hypothetical protein
MEKIKEEDNIQNEWYEEAREMTLEKLPDFLDHLLTDYEHDYGTICHALSAGSVATAWAMNKADQGGITGFQAGFVMWGFIQNWSTQYKDKPLRLIDFHDMLYPQYEYKFDKTISEDTWKYLQEEAGKLLRENKGVPEVRKHWTSVKNGVVPFGHTVKRED